MELPARFQSGRIHFRDISLKFDTFSHFPYTFANIFQHFSRMSQDNLIKMECTVCKSLNYRSKKNKKILKDRLELKKFCEQCRKHQAHKETK